MAQPPKSEKSGKAFDEGNSRDRRLVSGTMSLQIRNLFPQGAFISGTCTFYFKNLADEKYVGSEVVDHSAAAVPHSSVLVFEPTSNQCVSAFSADLKLTTPNSAPRNDKLVRVDLPGRCWAFLNFDWGNS